MMGQCASEKEKGARITLPVYIVLVAFVLGMDMNMTTVPASAFSDPNDRSFVQLVADGNINGALAAAQSAPNGVNSVGSKGETPLLIAIYRGDRNMVSALIKAGANVNDSAALSPLAIAAERFDIWFVETLLAAGTNPDSVIGSESALWRAALAGRRNVVDVLLRYNAKIDLANADGDTPALAAAAADKFSMVSYLLARGASPFAHSQRGFTLGFWAARSRLLQQSEEGQNKENVISFLREKGFPWPPMKGADVLLAEKRGEWPPTKR